MRAGPPSFLAQAIGTQAAGPVTVSARLCELDGVRGVALLGILVANARQMLLPWDVAEFAAPINGNERLAWLDWQFFHAFVDFKFISLFSLLFGVGFAIQSERLRDTGFIRSYLRRLGILALFGLIHAVLLYPAEVLLPYAVGGFLLLTAHRWSGRTMLRVGVFMLGVALLWQSVCL